MQENDRKKGLHIHNYVDLDFENILEYDFIILGSVFCTKSRIDNNVDIVINICEKIKKQCNKLKIYLQQPFYLNNNSELFIDFIMNMYSKKLIDGAIVNGIGIIKSFNEDIEIVISRFTIGKRKRVSNYFFELLKGHNVIAIECFSDDLKLIDDVIQNSKLPLWVRKSTSSLYSFSSKCIVEKYLSNCCEDPAACANGVYSILNSKHNGKFIVSGYALYKDCISDLETYAGNCDSIIYNLSGYEI